jgi:hypothetical protein
MHIGDVNKGKLGANDIGTLAVAGGQIATVSTGDGAVTIAGQSQQTSATSRPTSAAPPPPMR